MTACVHPMGPCYGPTDQQPAREAWKQGDASAAIEQPFFSDGPRWRPIYHGIEFAELATDVPRELIVRALRIDPSVDGLEMVTTPGNGDHPLETDGQTTRAFLEEHDLAVAINTHFFAPCCSRVAGEAKDLIGLSISGGQMVSPPVDDGQPAAIIFDEDLRPFSLRTIEEQAGVLITESDHAIAGRLVLDGGAVASGSDEFSTAQHPRTLVGYSEGNGMLYLVTIDGRQPGYSMGATLAESAALMHLIGASHALNVDGGGSTTMIIRDADGASQLANSPSGRAERVVGSNLGFRALPVQPVVSTDR